MGRIENDSMLKLEKDEVDQEEKAKGCNHQGISHLIWMCSEVPVHLQGAIKVPPGTSSAEEHMQHRGT